MSGSHYAPEPERTEYDLRTATQHEADALAQLALRIDNLVDALVYTVRRIDVLERTVAAHADRLTVLALKEGL